MDILAVIVTYNRLDLLKRCYNGIKAQSKQDFDILIVNNGSTDGTKEWIDSLSDNVIKIHQENLGGAGGFYAGQKYGYDNGYEWIWMMDDDGVPDKDQLSELLKVADATNAKIIGPVVLNIDRPEEEAFYPDNALPLPQGDISFKTRYVCPFNGVIFNKKVIDAIGFINKYLFIWGDEREYTLRWRKNGFKEVAALKAIHYHPTIKTKKANVFPGISRFKVNVKPKRFTKYYYRNNGYINRNYYTIKVAVAEFLMYTLYFVRKFDFAELFKFVKYYTKGYKTVIK